MKVNVDGSSTNTGDTPLNIKEVNTSMDVGKQNIK